ncbi:MAG: hypothetical protein IKQ31_03260 [Clostridia bacterium]|nr:hypothetical protein [Clostridia bacterium]
MNTQQKACAIAGAFSFASVVGFTLGYRALTEGVAHISGGEVLACLGLAVLFAGTDMYLHRESKAK